MDQSVKNETVMKSVNIRIHSESYDRWELRASRENRSLAAFVRNAVEVYLKVVER